MEIRYTKHIISNNEGTRIKYKKLYIYKNLSDEEKDNIDPENNTIQLDPCPFCGFSGFLNCSYLGYFGWCSICGTEGPKGNWREAADMWNNRNLHTVAKIKHINLSCGDVNFFDDKNIEEAIHIKEEYENKELLERNGNEQDR